MKIQSHTIEIEVISRVLILLPPRLTPEDSLLNVYQF